MVFAHPCTKCHKHLTFDTDFPKAEVTCVSCKTVNQFPGMPGLHDDAIPIVIDKAAKLQTMKKAVNGWRTSARPQEQDMAKALLFCLEEVEGLNKWIEDFEKPPVAVDPVGYVAMTNKQLADICEARGLKTYGAKQDLIDRIEANDKEAKPVE
jgi:phage FluMu protein Com